MAQVIIPSSEETMYRKAELSTRADRLPAVAKTAAPLKLDMIPLQAKAAMLRDGMQIKTRRNQAALQKLPQMSPAQLKASSDLSKEPVKRQGRLSQSQKEFLMTSLVGASGGSQSVGDATSVMLAHRFGFMPRAEELDAMRRSAKKWILDQLNSTALDFGMQNGFKSMEQMIYEFSAVAGNLNAPARAQIMASYMNESILYQMVKAKTKQPVAFRLAEFLAESCIPVRFHRTTPQDYWIAMSASAYMMEIFVPLMFAGTYADILKKTVRSLGHMFDLDGQFSRYTVGQLSLQNYARELLELHTVGVDGGYGQADIEGLADLFTGLRISRTHLPNSGGGKFYVDLRYHAYNKAKTVPFLGLHLPAPGWNEANVEAQIDTVMEALARHPKTARRFGLKLVQYFLHDNPDSVAELRLLVDQLRDVYLQNGGRLLPVFKTFFESAPAYRPTYQKTPQPQNWLTGLIRAGGLSGRGSLEDGILFANVIENYLPMLNQPFKSCPTPEGWLLNDGKRYLNDAQITQYFKMASMLAPSIAAKMSATDFYNRVLGAYAGPSSRSILGYVASEPVTAIIATALSPEALYKGSTL